MKLSIEKNVLLEKLNLVQGIAERRATMPILSHILFKCSESRVNITATDLETTLSTWAEAEIEKNGNVSGMAIPARKLYEIIKELPEGTIEIEEIKNNWIELKTSSGNYKIAGLPGDDFPILPEIQTDDFFTIDTGILDELISKTIYSVSPDDLRRNLAGIYFEKTENGSLRLVATDGHRLSLAEKKTDEDVVLKSNVLVPRKAVSELRKLLKQLKSIKIGYEKNFFITTGEDLVLFSRIIDADFPDYKQVIPENSEIEIILSRDVFLSALKRVCVFSSEKTKSVKLNLENNSITLTSVSPDVGEAKESFNVDYQGEPKEVGFNGNYIIDVLETMSESEIKFLLTDELSPTVLKPAENDNYISVVMPMRI